MRHYLENVLMFFSGTFIISMLAPSRGLRGRATPTDVFSLPHARSVGYKLVDELARAAAKL